MATRPLVHSRAGCPHRATAEDQAIAAAATLLLTVPNQLGVEYNTHALESIVEYVAPGLVGADGRGVALVRGSAHQRAPHESPRVLHHLPEQLGYQ